MAGAAEVGAAEAVEAVEAVWRIESARLVAGLGRLIRDVGLAEELAQDALVRGTRRPRRSSYAPSR